MYSAPFGIVFVRTHYTCES